MASLVRRVPWRGANRKVSSSMLRCVVQCKGSLSVARRDVWWGAACGECEAQVTSWPLSCLTALQLGRKLYDTFQSL